MPTVPPYIIEPISSSSLRPAPGEEDEPSSGLPPPPYIPDRVVFEKLVQVLVFGCAYEKIADGSCSATLLGDPARRSPSGIVATSGSGWG